MLPDGTPSELSVSRVLVARDQITRPDDYDSAERAIERDIEEGSRE